MNFSEKQFNLADIAVAIGVNIQEGQHLIINSPIECAFFARMVAERGFARGAGDVSIRYNDEKFARIRYDHAGIDALTTVADWQKDRLQSAVDEGAAVISIYADDPRVMEGVDADKVKAASNAFQAAAQPYHIAIINNQIRWCVISVPTPGWAEKMFPDVSTGEAMDKLWNAIFKTTRTDQEDPIAAWKAHNDSFAARCAFLNSKQFDRFVYKNGRGTDITVGMPAHHIWAGGQETAQDGLPFFPNIPTEEIFCAPDKNRIDGTLASSHPLVYNGQLIDNFTLTFKDGVVCDFHAQTGEGALKSLVEANEGSDMLGEIALVPYDSPISNLDLLFYNTLFDENASCHFALGSAYPTCVEGGSQMTPEELSAAGLNVSTTHVDFMVGTDDLSITAFDADGQATAIFRDGNWAF